MIWGLVWGLVLVGLGWLHVFAFQTSKFNFALGILARELNWGVHKRVGLRLVLVGFGFVLVGF